MFVCLPACLSACLPAHLSTCLPACLSVITCWSFALSLSVSLFHHLLTFQQSCRSICLYLSLPLCFFCPSMCPFLRPFFYPSICLLDRLSKIRRSSFLQPYSYPP